MVRRWYPIFELSNFKGRFHPSNVENSVGSDPPPSCRVKFDDNFDIFFLPFLSPSSTLSLGTLNPRQKFVCQAEGQSRKAIKVAHQSAKEGWQRGADILKPKSAHCRGLNLINFKLFSKSHDTEFRVTTRVEAVQPNVWDAAPATRSTMGPQPNEYYFDIVPKFFSSFFSLAFYFYKTKASKWTSSNATAAPLRRLWIRYIANWREGVRYLPLWNSRLEYLLTWQQFSEKGNFLRRFGSPFQFVVAFVFGFSALASWGLDDERKCRRPKGDQESLTLRKKIQGWAFGIVFHWMTRQFSSTIVTICEQISGQRKR